MSKLRLSFLHKLGGTVAIGDILTDSNKTFSTKENDMTVLMASIIVKDKSEAGVFINSFAPRINTGEQPLHDDFPVVVKLGSSQQFGAVHACSIWKWEIKGKIKSWRPDIDALIKLQDDHDQAIPTFSESLRNNRPVFEEKLKKVEIITDAAKISECFNDDKQEGDKMNAKLNGYTQDMKDLNVAPEVGMKCNILHHLNLEEATFIAVTDRFLILKNIDGVERMRLTDNINESIFPEHSGEDVEQEAANKKQLDTFPPALRNAGYFVQVDMIKFMQDEGMLAEVLLPLK